MTIQGFPYCDFYFIATKKNGRTIRVQIDLNETPVYGICHNSYEILNTFYLDEETARNAYDAYLANYTKLALENGWKINESIVEHTGGPGKPYYNGVDRYFEVTSNGERVALYGLTKWSWDNCCSEDCPNKWKD